MRKRNGPQPALTLIELLVVIAVIAVLSAIALPSLVRVKERARRTVCQATLRGFYLAAAAYATGHDDCLPPGGDTVEDDYPDYLFLLQGATHQSLAGEAHRALACPNLRKPFKGGAVPPFRDRGYITDIDGYLIGYNYLGGFWGTPWPVTGPAQTAWVSPQKMTDRPREPLVTELNAWIDSGQYRMTFAPHGARGPIHDAGDSTNQRFNGIAPDQRGAVGGHITTLDGVIQWKEIDQMTIHRASRGATYPLWAYW